MKERKNGQKACVFCPKGVLCSGKGRCQHCGWNPKVAKARNARMGAAR